MFRVPKYLCVVAGACLLAPVTAGAQSQSAADVSTPRPAAGLPDPTRPPGATDPLTELVADALNRSPRLLATRHETEALRARVPQAGAWDDPVLTFGVMNLRARSLGFADDPMTMKSVQLAQRIPLPGQISHRREATAFLAESGEYAAEGARIEVASAVKTVYAELYYRDRAIEIVQRNLAILQGLQDVTRVRYATGVGRQPAVLRARLESDALEGERIQLLMSRQSELARLNSLRDRAAATPVETGVFPPDLMALTEARSGGPTFVSALSGGTAPGLALPQGVPSLDSLIALALEGKPEVRAHMASIAAQGEVLALTQALRWPAPQLSIGYGQRDGLPDMLNATVSIRLPLFRGAQQGEAVREEEAILAREHAQHRNMAAFIERDVTAAYSGVLAALGQLQLYDRGILARSEATLEATLAAYRTGAEDFLALLDSQARLHRLELERHRRLADLLVAWAALERAVGVEIAP